MGHCAGFCNGVKKKVSPSGMEFATVAKRLVAKMGSDFLIQVLMVVPDDTELQMAVGGVGSAGFVAQTKVVAVLRNLEGNGVFCCARRTRLHIATRWEPCGLVLVEALRSGRRFIVAPTGLWTDGKMTVEALVEQEFTRRGDPCQE
ncbi:WAXY [Symbiodinium sp. CCMP2456]|nr:WAXY [Symbiodinium sp. CCMP2456]